jgi:hypothetical protein
MIMASILRCIMPDVYPDWRVASRDQLTGCTNGVSMGMRFSNKNWKNFMAVDEVELA